MKVSIIVAVAENRAIGKDDQLPWHLPNDLKFFKQKTMGHFILMGRKTYESIGKPLPGRTNVLITQNTNYKAAGVSIVHSLAEAVSLAKAAGETEAFVIGGAGLINEALKIADNIYWTEVKTEVEDADVFIRDFDMHQWKETEREEHASDACHAHSYCFVKLEKKDA